jgi:hypothetical protein
MDTNTATDDLQSHFKRIAELERAYEISLVENKIKIRAWEEELEHKLDELKAARWEYYIKERKVPLSLSELDAIRKKDSDFVASWESKGFPVKNLECWFKQKQDEDALNIECLTATNLRIERDQAEEQHRLLEADQRLTILIGNELREIVKETILEVLSRGR